MKRLVAIAITVILSALLSTTTTLGITNEALSSTFANLQDDWVKFRSDAGQFTVLMPETPTDKSETVDSAHGPYTTHLFIARDSKYVCLVGWVDYDPKFNFNRQAELEANRDNFIKGVNATLLSTRSVVLDGYQALEFTSETADRIFNSRVYIVGRRPYQVVIGYPKAEGDASVINRFLSSFKVSTGPLRPADHQPQN